MADQIVVITDTSVLIKFLVIDQVRLMTSIPGRQFMVTDHVRSEVTEHFPEQLIRLEHALTIGILVEIVVADIAEVQAFARLTATGLGVGECSAIAVASCRGHAIALDDKLARKRIANLYPTLAVLTTESIVIDMIRAGIINVTEADAIKADWEANHRFKLSFSSFADRV